MQLYQRTLPYSAITPQQAYRQLKGEQTALIELRQGGSKCHPITYSYVGRKPIKQLRCKASDSAALEKIKQFSVEPTFQPALHSPFGGPIILMAYDAIRFIEAIPDQHLYLEADDVVMLQHSEMLLFDHAKQELQALSFSSEKALNQLISDLFEPIQESERFFIPSTTPIPELDDKSFCQRVLKAKEHILKGDLFQIVLSRAFLGTTPLSAEALYARLSLNHPAPYQYLIEVDELSLIGGSPERQVILEGRRAESSPIAGTRSLKNLDALQQLSQELLQDVKENAEHLMLVDLARNDLGKVCQPGTVKVKALRQIQQLPTLLHLVSRVEGKLCSGQDAIDLLFATFPAGTLTGAPKIRAMQLIDHLEVSRRGFYGGVLGFFDLKGNFDSTIIIRTLFLERGQVTLRAGAGIVYDSDPQSEADETYHKVAGLLAILADVKAEEVA